ANSEGQTRTSYFSRNAAFSGLSVSSAANTMRSANGTSAGSVNTKACMLLQVWHHSAQASTNSSLPSLRACFRAPVKSSWWNCTRTSCESAPGGSSLEACAGVCAGLPAKSFVGVAAAVDAEGGAAGGGACVQAGSVSSASPATPHFQYMAEL